MIEIYTTATCKYCKEVKKFLDEHEIDYTEVDATDPENRAELVEMTGKMSVPVTVIGKHIVPGWNEEALTEALEKEGYTV